KANLTETVRHYQDFLPIFFPLIHPSPLNQIWLKKNAWYEQEVVPVLQQKVKHILDG
ncbi:MAG: uracil-DNA glycosylase family protein, partial [Saprospiraceae bacterium]|nr:uracil-DNA glycosylase family protein [Saprospiraceae bacterium]